jgi:hypothetical protein
LSIYDDNLSVISRRWPQLSSQIALTQYQVAQVQLVEDKQVSLVFDNIQLESSHDQIAEASCQLEQLNITSKKVTLYGSTLGTIQTLLLARQQLSQLSIVILNLAVFKACLSCFDQRSWLEDKRVLLRTSEQNEQLSRPFIALPAALTLASEESSPLRDRVCLALDHNFINEKRGVNNKALLAQLNSNINYIKKDLDVKRLFLSKNNKSFIVCGAGPTLAEHYDFLSLKNTRDNFTLVAVDAAVIPLCNNGIMPDIVVSIDPVAKKLFKDVNMGYFKKVPLVYFPVISESLLSAWQGPRYTAYSKGELYNSINGIHAKGRLYCGGSVIHPAIDLVIQMGANKVLLLGADFSFPGGKTHTHWQEDVSDDAVHIAVEQSPHWVLNGFNERVPTLLNYRGYLRDLEDYISLVKHVDFYNGSRKGATIRGTRIWPPTS